MKPKLFFLLALVCLIFCQTVSATIPITSVSTQTSIVWSWQNGLTLTNMSIDGIYVCGFDATASSFVLDHLGQNETHTIKIVTAGDSGTNTATTAANTVTGLIESWWYVVLIAILCVIGMMRKLGIFLLIGSGVSFYALYVFITTNVIQEGNPLVQLPLMIYLILFIVPIYLALVVKRGVFK